MFASKLSKISSSGKKTSVALGAAALVVSAGLIWPQTASAFGGGSAALVCGQMGPPMFGSQHIIAAEPGECPGFGPPAQNVVHRRAPRSHRYQ